MIMQLGGRVRANCEMKYWVAAKVRPIFSQRAIFRDLEVAEGIYKKQNAQESVNLHVVPKIFESGQLRLLRGCFSHGSY